MGGGKGEWGGGVGSGGEGGIWGGGGNLGGGGGVWGGGGARSRHSNIERVRIIVLNSTEKGSVFLNFACPRF